MRRLSLGQPLGATVDAKVNWLVDAVKRIELASNEDFAEVTPIKPISGLTDIKNVQSALEGLQTGKEPTNALLTAIAALSMVADRYIYGDGANSVALGTITSFVRTLLDDADAATFLATLGISTGTFTPTLEFSTPGTSTFSYASQQGNYWVISGQIVVARVNLVVTPTVGTGTGEARIAGLPITNGIRTSHGWVREISANWTWGAGFTQVVASVLASTSYVSIRVLGTASNSGALQASSMTNGASHNLGFTVVYFL